MSAKLLTEHHLEFISLKRVYSCQNATLLESTCHGSNKSLKLRNIKMAADTALEEI